MRAKSSGKCLTAQDASVIKGMLARGDRQHDIAAWFGVNGGRVAEIARGKRFSWAKPATEPLPPQGPYMNPQEAVEARVALEQALVALAKAEAALGKLYERSC
jgi:hypothetical protein